MPFTGEQAYAGMAYAYLDGSYGIPLVIGINYATEGRFLRVGSGLMQVEMDVPVPKRPFVGDLFGHWVRMLTPPRRGER